MTANPESKLSLIPALIGLFFVLFVSAATGLLFQHGAASPWVVFSVAGMAVVGVYTMKKLLVRGRDAELAMAEGERYIEGVADLSQDAHAMIDVEARSFLYLNPALENLLGYPMEAWFQGGLAFYNSLLHPEDLQAHLAQEEALLKPLRGPLGPDESEPVLEQVFRIRNHHGDYRWFKARSMVFVRRPDGHALETLAVIQDITETRANEAALIEAQKMESLGAMARGGIHDLSNALMGIQGFAEMAQRSSSNPQALAGHLEHLQRGVERASALCRQTLGFTGQGRIQIAAHPLNQVVKQSLSAIENLVPQGGVLHLELDKGQPMASLDLGQARSALLILAYNAAESIRIQGGEVAIRTGIRPAAGGSGPSAWLEVAITGAALPPEALEKISDPLFSTLFPGHGLGLSAVRGILSEHKGQLEAENLGNGYAVRLHFPLAQILPEIDAGDEGTPVVGSAGVVLVVDDEPSIRSVLRHGLEFDGYKVIEAEDGGDGLAAFMRHRSSISIVLLDWTMPRMDGAEVLAEIRKVAPEMPVVLMSGYPEAEAAETFSGEELAGFLSKPCSVKEVVTVVRKALAPK